MRKNEKEKKGKTTKDHNTEKGLAKREQLRKAKRAWR